MMEEFNLTFETHRIKMVKIEFDKKAYTHLNLDLVDDPYRKIMYLDHYIQHIRHEIFQLKKELKHDG